jgi:hypothetical protein
MLVTGKFGRGARGGVILAALFSASLGRADDAALAPAAAEAAAQVAAPAADTPVAPAAKDAAAAETVVPAATASDASAAEAAAAAADEAPSKDPALAESAETISAAPASADDALAVEKTPAAITTAIPGELLPAPPPPPATLASPVTSIGGARKSYRRFGLGLDAGFPDISSANVLYRPFRYLRFSGGVLYNYAGFGVRGGASIQPYFPIAPSLTFEAGHYFEANVRAKVERYEDVDANIAPLLERVGYSFASAQVGLELGHHNAFVFFVRAGVTRMWMTPKNAGAAARAATEGDSTRITDMQDPKLTAQLPCAKLGFLVFFK